MESLTEDKSETPISDSAGPESSSLSHSAWPLWIPEPLWPPRVSVTERDHKSAFFSRWREEWAGGPDCWLVGWIVIYNAGKGLGLMGLVNSTYLEEVWFFAAAEAAGSAKHFFLISRTWCGNLKREDRFGWPYSGWRREPAWQRTIMMKMRTRGSLAGFPLVAHSLKSHSKEAPTRRPLLLFFRYDDGLYRCLSSDACCPIVLLWTTNSPGLLFALVFIAVIIAFMTTWRERCCLGAKGCNR